MSEKVVVGVGVVAANGTATGTNTNTEIYMTLSNLMGSGIEIDKNLRQPTYYTWLDCDELKIDAFYVITDLLTHQKIPHWLSQRIGWYYSNKFFQEIVDDLSLANSDKLKNDSKLFNREKLVVYLRKTISKIIKEWLNERSRLNNQGLKSLLFSFNRTANESIKHFVYSEYGIKNKRRIMEDRTAIYENVNLLTNALSSDHLAIDLDASLSSVQPASGQPTALVGVFDGHCGADCAQYVCTHLPMSIIKHPNLTTALESSNDSAIRKLFHECFTSVNDQFSSKAKDESMRSGSTACICLLSSRQHGGGTGFKKLALAWCGDSQACLIKNGRVSFINDIHKPDSEKEKQRIEKHGGTVSFSSNAWRINGSLSVARSFGDVEYQSNGVICEPDVKCFHLDGTEDYLVLGCDGLWECMSPDDVCKFVYQLTLNGSTVLNIAEQLVKKARDNGSTDNITAIFVLLKDSLASIAKPQ